MKRIAMSLARNASAWDAYKRFVQKFLNDGLVQEPPGTYSRIEPYRDQEMAKHSIESWFIHCMKVSFFHKGGRVQPSTRTLSRDEISALLEVEPLIADLVAMVPPSSQATLDLITDETAGLAITAVRDYFTEMAEYKPEAEPKPEAKPEPRSTKASGTYRKPIALQQVS